MKTTLNTLLFIFSSFFISMTNPPQDSCNTKLYVDKGVRVLTEENGYTFLKSYTVSGEDEKKYSYIFSQGTKYMIALANHDSDAKGVYITLYDSNNKKIASSIDPETDKTFSAIAFTCKRTGIYHMNFGFKNTRKKCAAGVLGMKR